MIGNDVIDLALAQKESNWKRRGFLDKIFTAEEKCRISNAENPETMVWDLWSRKEAVYKIYNRQTQIRAYIPLQLECFDLDEKNGITYGKAICYDKTYFTKTIITPDHIETTALETPDFDNVKYLNPDKIVVKINGIPNYYDIENQVLKPMSKSHHGRFEKLVTL